MNKFFTKRLSIISFSFIPIIFLWHPNWLGLLGVQPYWPLFWLLPWSMMNGSINGLIFGLFLGLILDSITLDNNFSQIPGLICCGFLFGRIKLHSDVLVGHFRYGLICSFGSFLCGTLYLLQILFRNFSDSNFLMFGTVEQLASEDLFYFSLQISILLVVQYHSLRYWLPKNFHLASVQTMLSVVSHV